MASALGLPGTALRPLLGAGWTLLSLVARKGHSSRRGPCPCPWWLHPQPRVGKMRTALWLLFQEGWHAAWAASATDTHPWSSQQPHPSCCALPSTES